MKRGVQTIDHYFNLSFSRRLWPCHGWQAVATEAVVTEVVGSVQAATAEHHNL